MDSSELLFKYCPKCGSANIAKNTFKSYLCQDCGFNFYFNSAAAVVGIIKNEDNNILFTIRKNHPKAGYLDLPGGFVDYNESAEEALAREIKEELGASVTSLKYYKSYPNIYLYNNVKYYTMDSFFFCTLDSISTLVANDDISGFVFKKLQSLKLEEFGFDSTKKIVLDLIKEF